MWRILMLHGTTAAVEFTLDDLESFKLIPVYANYVASPDDRRTTSCHASARLLAAI